MRHNYYSCAKIYRILIIYDICCIIIRATFTVTKIKLKKPEMTMKTRINFLDNLRTFLIFLVVLYHAGFVFQSALATNWIVVDAVKTDSIGLIGLYIDLFVMFTMFFISGYLIPRSVEKNTTWEYVKSKFKRIMVPWLLAVFTLIPAYKFLFLYSRGLPQQEWYTYFHLFQRADSNWFVFANDPTQHWLWFLPVLFLFQVLYLIMARTKMLSMKLSLRTAVISTFVIGLVYSMVIARTGLIGWSLNWVFDFQRERLLIYFMIFLLGSLCYKLGVFESRKSGSDLFIVSNVVLVIALGVYTVFALNLFMNLADPGRQIFIISEVTDPVVFFASQLISMLSFLQILVYSFRKWLGGTNRILTLLNRGSYNVYIIHMVVMGVVALPLVRMDLSFGVKYLGVILGTYVLSNALVILYQRYIQNHLIMRTSAFVLLVTLLITLVATDGAGQRSNDNIQAGFVNSQVAAPEIGLHEAVIKGNLEVVKQHIKAGSDLDIADPTGGSSPLITAATFGKTEIAIALIEGGADLNFRNNDGSTPLITAAFFCRIDIVKVLLEKGADKSLKNNFGSTAYTSVSAPYEQVAGIYDYFRGMLAPMGFELSAEDIQTLRPKIAQILQ